MKPLMGLVILFGTAAMPALAAPPDTTATESTCLACHRADGTAGHSGLRNPGGAARFDHTTLAGRAGGMAHVESTVEMLMAQAPPASAPTTPAPVAGGVAAVNRFNRLLPPPGQHNPPPVEDGIHDPASEGTQALQAPREAFAPLPKATAGNRVDWVRAFNDGQVRPRHDLANPAAEPLVMDLNIVREVKGTMPHVVFPHKQHTQWLDCSNCHPAIFIPQKGANQMSMASILLGEGCGMCHGKVAFPVSDCRKCHAGNAIAPAAGGTSP